MYHKTNHALLKEELEALLRKLAEMNALEIQTIGDTVYLPYMMNDAVEDYIRLDEARVMGNLNPDEKDPAIVKTCPAENPTENRSGVIIRQASGNTVSVWFRSAWRCASCYQYHRIGHSWRSTPGEEDWRRLVNLVCVIYDKIEYLGMDFTNQTEAELALLAEFAPFIWWSPLNEPVMQWYPSSADGTDAFIWLCREAGDEELILAAQDYEQRRAELEEQIAACRDDSRPPADSQKGHFVVLAGGRILRFLQRGRSAEKKQEALQEKLREEQNRMALMLLLPEHDQVYRCLMKKLEEASLGWPARNYGKAENARIEGLRQEAQQRYHSAGYEGSYPLFTRTDSEGGRTEILLVEEHPFTVLEWEDYSFQIYEIRKRIK